MQVISSIPFMKHSRFMDGCCRGLCAHATCAFVISVPHSPSHSLQLVTVLKVSKEVLLCMPSCGPRTGAAGG